MSQSKELSTIESLKTSKYVFKWLLVLVIMGIINIILGKSYGPLKENFFTSDLTGRFLSSKKLMMIYTLLCFAVIYGVREKTRLRAYKGNTKEENTEDIKDFLIYIVISLSTFLYASAYIRRKFNSGTGVISGGGNDGILSDTVNKISSTGFSTLTIYVGLLVILLNVITNSFQYLKNKGKNQKDKILRAIYFGQISTMLQFLVTSFFVVGFGMSIFQEKSPFKIGTSLFKWILFISFAGVGIHLINKGTNFENWFGEPKKVDNANVNNPNINPVPDQNNDKNKG